MINDFIEILGRGVIAARTGRTREAVKYLTLAAELSPRYPRVWLWLAAVEDHPDHRRRYLEQTLRVDPGNLVARVLLDRLNRRANAVSQPASDFAIFTCPNCGGKQRFDPDLSGLVCEFCKQIEPLAVENASDRKSDLHAAFQQSSGSWAVMESEAACGACGAKTLIPPEHAALRCPFCASDLVTLRPATPGLQPPSGIVPFQLHSGDVLELLENDKPGLFRRARPFDPEHGSLTPIYLPFWSFQGRVQIRCALTRRVPAEEYSNTERVIIKGEIMRENSWFECDIHELLVYAARSVSGGGIDEIAPFDLKSVLAYRPEMLAGWQAELYQVALEDAAVMAHKRMRDIAFQRAARRLLFMEPSHMLNGDVLVVEPTCQLVLLPVWIARYEDGAVRLVNGQTGKMGKFAEGER